MRFFDIFGIDPRGCACMFVALTALGRAWHADPAQREAESVAAKRYGVPWQLRGPRLGPGKGGPTTWRGSKWRPATQK